MKRKWKSKSHHIQILRKQYKLGYFHRLAVADSKKKYFNFIWDDKNFDNFYNVQCVHGWTPEEGFFYFWVFNKTVCGEKVCFVQNYKFKYQLGFEKEIILKKCSQIRGIYTILCKKVQ